MIHLGHGGDDCPSYNSQFNQSGMSSGMDRDDLEEGWEDEGLTDSEEPRDTAYSNQALWGPDLPNTQHVVVVTSSGILRRRMKWCRCSGTVKPHIQLLQLNLFSASIERPSTVFTFDVLDHFHIDAMECKTAALNFYNKLRRFTSNAFPRTSPVS